MRSKVNRLTYVNEIQVVQLQKQVGTTGEQYRTAKSLNMLMLVELSNQRATVNRDVETSQLRLRRQAKLAKRKSRSALKTRDLRIRVLNRNVRFLRLKLNAKESKLDAFRLIQMKI